MPRQSTVCFPVSKRRSLRTIKNSPRIKKNKENEVKNYVDCEPPEAVDRKSVSIQRQPLGSPAKKVRFDDSSNISTKNTEVAVPKSVYVCKQDTSPLQKAKGVFHIGMTSRLIGREKEISQICDFVTEHLNLRKPGSLYISGAPGTGKTSCLMHVLDTLKAEFCSVFINCMSVTTTAGIYRKIGNELGLSVKLTSSKNISELEKSIVTFKSMVVLIFDEVDQLDSKGQEVLYKLFEWPQLPNSSVILIGIANALDLTDRILPRLHVFSYQPELMHFQPYSREQIIHILEDRLSIIQSGDNIVIKPAALQLCARKIAACTGDIRKALEVCRRAIEVVENEARQQLVLQCTSDDRCNEGSPRKRSLAPVTKYVDLRQINAVLQQVYGSRIKNSSTSDSVTLPLQQKILLCTLSLMVKNCKSSDFTLGRLYDVYRRVCRKRQMSEIDEGEFQSLCGLIEARGFIELKNNKVARLSKFALKIDENEIVHVLQDQTLLSSILSDKSVVNKHS